MPVFVLVGPNKVVNLQTVMQVERSIKQDNTLAVTFVNGSSHFYFGEEAKTLWAAIHDMPVFSKVSGA